MKQVLILQGPNLNLLGKREPDIYGTQTLEDIHTQLRAQAKTLNLSVDFFQSNAEAALIERLHVAMTQPIDWVVINPAAYTHTSVALRDALLAINKPFIEVHLSNVHARETFRQHSYFSDVAIAVITGMGAFGYTAALHFISQQQ